jgi:ribosomal protein S18 acetylase RimI-like enzyme
MPPMSNAASGEPKNELVIRPARLADLPEIAVLAGELVRMHHAVDPERFLLPERVEEGYAWWLERELGRAEAVVVVATIADQIVGYAYGTREGRDWNALLDEHGAIHDVFVATAARRGGAGRKLVESMVEELERRGAPRVVLSTMVGNEAAQRLFAACGFRRTMLEMTRSSPSLAR